MKLKTPVTLIGLMGAGKTTVGAFLARRLNVDFLDSDQLIERAAGATVAEIFERDGESFFRKVEEKIIKAKLEEQMPIILATGGGAIMNERIRETVKENSISVWLRADLETLVKRVESNDSRPLLNNKNKREVLEKLIEERYPVYEQADIVVDTTSNSRTIITNNILNKIERFNK